jgi:hypothetical protein
MTAILGGVLQNLCIGLCLLSPVVFFFSAAAFLRVLPPFFRFLHRCLRVLLIVSYRLYRWVLLGMSSLVGMELAQGWLRVLVTTIFSTLVGLGTHALAHWSLSWWSLGLFLLHGLCVGLIWDEIEKPGGVQVGVTLE